MNDADCKRLMLQKGERIGFAVVLCIMVLLLLAGGVATVKSDSPTSIAGSIQSKASLVEDRLQNGEATSSGEISSQARGTVSIQPVPLEKHPIKSPFFQINSMERTKRLNPDVLQPDEFQADLIQASARSYDIITEGGKIKIGRLVTQEKLPPKKEQPKSRQEIYRERLKEYYEKMGSQFPAPSPNSNLMSSRQLASLAGELDQVKYRLEYVPVEQMDPRQDKLAITMYPSRMVVVSASFPFKAQLDGYRRALRLPTLDALLKDKDSVPQFLGIHVQRRVVKPHAQMKEDEGWEVLDTNRQGVAWANYRWLLQRAVEPEPEDPRLAQAVILNKSMVMPRPRLGKDSDSYPPIRLKNITNTVAAYEKATRGKESLAISPFNRRLSGEADIFNLEGSAKPADNLAAAPPTGDPRQTDFLPDHILIRFIDVTVKPGFTYEYRMQMRLTNPNYEKKDLVAYPYLAQVQELPAPWSQLLRVPVPTEVHYYTVEEKPANYYDRDMVFVQVHRWLDYARLNPAQRDTEVPVADWTIREVPVHRGEYIGQMMDKTEVIIWYPTREVFDFAINPIVARAPRPKGAPLSRGIPVDFSTNPRALLVDFEGGKGQLMTFRRAGQASATKIMDDSSVELLIMTEDGRLLVRNSQVDNQDPDRNQRYSAWKSQIEETRKHPAGILKKADDVFRTNPK